MSKRKISIEDKVYAVNLYLDGKESQNRIVSMFGVSKHKYIYHMGFLEFLKGHHGLFLCQECDTILKYNHFEER